jgi:hypothetical protein
MKSKQRLRPQNFGRFDVGRMSLVETVSALLIVVTESIRNLQHTHDSLYAIPVGVGKESFAKKGD